MKQLWLHPQNPEPRRIAQLMVALQRGDMIALPTTLGYRLASVASASQTLTRMLKLASGGIREVMCCFTSIKQLAQYASVNNRQYKMIKQHLNDQQVGFVLPTLARSPLKKHKPPHMRVVMTHSRVIHALSMALDEPLLLAATPHLEHADSWIDGEDLPHQSIPELRVLALTEPFHQQPIEWIDLRDDHGR